MNSPNRCFLLLGAMLFALSAAAVAPVADCKQCGISLDIPQDGLWQGLQKGGLTTFAMQRGSELFATIEVMKLENEARYSLDQLAKNYQEVCNPDIVIDGPFVSRTINGIPVRWGRGRGQAEDGGRFLVHLVFFAVGEAACRLTAITREQSLALYKNMLPGMIESLRRLPVLLDD
jgi:hypothetical protein